MNYWMGILAGFMVCFYFILVTFGEMESFQHNIIKLQIWFLIAWSCRVNVRLNQMQVSSGEVE